MAIIIRSKFDYGQLVYIKTDITQEPLQVIGVQGTADGGMLIKLTRDGEVSYHYECEITEDKNIMMITNN